MFDHWSHFSINNISNSKRLTIYGNKEDQNGVKIIYQLSGKIVYSNQGCLKYYKWIIFIRGPPDTSYEDGIF